MLCVTDKKPCVKVPFKLVFRNETRSFVFSEKKDTHARCSGDISEILIFFTMLPALEGL